MSTHLTGLPAKPALRHLFMFGWYRSQYGAVPKRRGKALSRVYRWWASLPEGTRADLARTAAHEIRVHNEKLRARREEMAQLRVDLLAKVQRLRAILGEPLS